MPKGAPGGGGGGGSASSSAALQGLPGSLSSAVDAWSAYAEGSVSHVVKAAGYIRFSLRIDAESGRRVVEPQHYVIAFPVRDQGKQKHHSALFTLRVVGEEQISRDPNTQGAVANHLRFKPPDERRLIPGANEYVEFELMSREHETPSQQPLRISMGPVRMDKSRGQKEFVRVDMGQCIKQIATDVVEDPRGSGRLVKNRWWMCIETLRLLCNADRIDCTALDKSGVPAQEWVVRLIDTHAPVNRKEEVRESRENRPIDDLMNFIESEGRPARGGGAAAEGAAPPRVKAKKKGGKEKDAGCAGDPATTPGTSRGAKADGAKVADAQALATSPSSSSTSRSKRPGGDEPQEPVSKESLGTKVAVDVREFLQVLDELERADAESEEDTHASRVIFQLVRKCEAKLRDLGLERVEALGKPFDPGLHRVAGEASPSVSPNQVVVEELESGWVVGNVVVRPCLVALG